MKSNILMLYIHTTLVNSEFLCVLVVFITVYLVHTISLAINLSLSLSKWGGGERWNNSPLVSGRGKEGIQLRMRVAFRLTSRTTSREEIRKNEKCLHFSGMVSNSSQYMPAPPFTFSPLLTADK